MRPTQRNPSRRLLLLGLLPLLLVGLAAVGQPGSAYLEDFESYGVDADPPGWFDTKLDKDKEKPELFRTRIGVVDPANIAYGLVKKKGDGFSHYRDRTFALNDGFRFDGRMLRTEAGALLGVSFFSSFPASSYYLLAQTRYDGTVELAACGAGDSGDDDSDSDSGGGSEYGECTPKPLAGVVDSGVTMAANVWHRFQIRAFPDGTGLRIVAKIWPEGEPEPGAFAIDAVDADDPALTGWIGAWASEADVPKDDDGDSDSDDDSDDDQDSDSGDDDDSDDDGDSDSDSDGDSDAPEGRQLWDDLSVTFDQAPPLIAIFEGGVELADGSLFNRTVVPVIQIEDASPFSATATLDGQPYTSGTPVPDEGIHQVVVAATDVYGNSSVKTVSFEIDLTPPVFLSVLPPDGTIAAITEVTLTGQVEGAVSVTVDGASAVLTGLDFSAGPFALAEGPRLFQLSAADLAGNVAQLDHTVVRDTTPPEVSIGQPVPGVLGATPITVSGTATDLHLAEVRVNGATASLNGSSYSLDDVALAEGANTILAEALDAAGNTGQAQVEVTLDTLAPTITILNGAAPLPDGFLTNGIVVPVVEVVDATPVSTEILLNGAPIASGTPVDVEGIFQLAVTATDAAGNSASAGVAFEIDRTPPVFVDVRPPANTILAAPEVVLEGEVSGAHSLTVDGQPATLTGQSFTTAPLPLAPGDNLFNLVATDLAGNAAQLGHPLVLDNVPPVIAVTESGVPLVDGALFNRTVVPVVTVQDDSPVTVEIRLDGQPFVSGAAVAAEGVHQLVVEAVDAAGNAASASASFEIDLTPPEFLGVEPPDGTITADAQVTLSGQVEGAAAVTIDGAPATLSGTAFSGGPFTLAEGDRTFLLAAVDAAGNQAQRLHRIVLDTTPPVVGILQPAVDVVGSTPITVSGTAVDLHLDQVTVNGGAAAIAGGTFTRTGVPLAEGANVLTVQAVDVVGNSGQADKTVVLDTLPPAITVLDGGAPLVDGLLTNQTVTPMVQVDDATQTDVEITLNGAPFVSGTPVDAEGVYTLSVLASDEAGNSSSASVGFEIDRTPPEFIDVQPPDGTILGATEVTLTGQVLGADQLTVDGTPAALAGDSFSAGPFPIAGSERTFELVATDAAGNSAQRAHRLLVDVTPPVLTILVPTDGAVLASPSVDVAGTAVDPNLAQVLVNGQAAALAGDDFTLAGLALAEGDNLIQAEASDTVGNASSAQVAVIVDTVAPAITVLEGGAPLTDGSLFNRAVTPVVEVDDATAVTVVATLNGLPFVSGTPVTIDGVYALAVAATDAAGNTSSETIGFEIDTAPPVFVSIEPADGTISADAEVTLIGQVTGADQLTVDAAPVPLAGESFSAGPYPLAEGERVWLLAATDAAGNQAETTHALVRDSTPPVVTVATPAEGELLGTVSVDVSGTVEDLHLTGVTVNGIEAAVTGESYLARQVPLAEGANLLSAVATDAAGNSGEAQVAVVLDTQPPTITITDPAAGSLLAASTVVVLGTAADPHLDRVEVNGVAATLAGSNWSLTAPLAEGANPLVAVAYDRLGNSAQDTVTVIRDLTAPELQITSPAEGALLNVETTDVTGTVDAEPGITVTVNGVAAVVDAGTFTAPDVPLVEGENRLIGRAVDTLGNTGIRTRIVLRDTTPPRFELSDPAGGALAVAPDTAFALTFSEELAAPQAGEWTLETAAGAPISATAELSGPLLTVRPDQPLPSATELLLTLTASLADPAGNALANPQTLLFGAADVGAPDPPVIDPVPPPYLCAATVSLTGAAEPGTTLVVTGGAAGLESPVPADGQFAVQVALVPNLLNALAVKVRDASGNLSSAVEVQVVQDCVAPFVVASRREGEQFVATFSEIVNPASVALAGAVTVSDSTGALAGLATTSADASEAVFSPDAALPDETLRFDVAQLVRDRAGNSLAYPYSRIYGAGVGESFITGTVLDNATGRPLAGAQVTVIATDGAPLPAPQPQQTTGDDGRFSLPVAAGTHEVAALRPGYTPVFRIATNQAQVGVDLFDPRLTPMAPTETFDSAGGTYRGAGQLALSLPAGELPAPTPIGVTALQEQGLPALLPYGWSPRGAAWIDLGGVALATQATLTLPVESPDGTQLAVAALDLATLQWRVRRLATVEGGAVTATTAIGEVLVAVEADAGPLAPPAATAGAILGSSPQPDGSEVDTAQLTFDPEVVLPAQRSLATAGYTLNADAASGLPLTLVIREDLELLDGSTRSAAPYQADLILYRAPGGAPRSRFFLRPSEAARLLPLSLGREDVTLRRFAGESVRGNVLGPSGGSVIDDQGDRLDVPAGAFAEPTAVLLRRGAAADLPVPPPAEGQLDGVLEIDAGGRSWGPSAGLTLNVDPAPAAGEVGVLLELVELDSGAAYRAVAALEPIASGWTTAAIDPLDLRWPGIRGDGTYLFLRHTQDVAYLRGTVFDVLGAPLPGAVVRADGLSWVQVSAADGAYVLPVPLGALTVSADNDLTGNTVSAAIAPSFALERIDLDLTMQIVAPSVVALAPADGAVDVPPGVSPTVQFSEAVDPLSLAGNVELLQGGVPVAVTFDARGALVTVLPAATLQPGTATELRVGTGVRDLQGFALTAPASSAFTTIQVLFNEDVDLTKVVLLEPDANGFATVVGQPGAVPFGTLVVVENTTSFVTTPSVEAGQDGSFLLAIEATVADRLLLHVILEGSNSLVLELTPFRTADGQGAYLGEEGGRFATTDDIVVTVEEGTFDAPTLVRVAPEPIDTATVPIPDGLTPVYAFTLDIDGAKANKGLRVSVPAPAGSADAQYLLTRQVDTFRGKKWMMDDLGRLEGDRFTTEEETGPEGAAPAGGTNAAAPGAAAQSEVSIQRLQASTLAAIDELPLVRQRRLAAGIGGVGGGAGGKTTQADDPGSPGTPRHMLPGMHSPVGRRGYQFWEANDPLGFSALPLIPNVLYFSPSMGMAAAVDAAVSRILINTSPSIVMPSRLQQPFDVEARDLTTGFKLFEDVFDPPPGPGEIVELPVDPTVADTEPPTPIGGSPLRLLLIEEAGQQGELVAPGIEVTSNSGSLTVTGMPDAAHEGVKVRLLSLDGDGEGFTTTGGDGSFSLSLAGEEGERFVLAIGVRVPTDQIFLLEFSEALDADLSGIEVTDLSGNDMDPFLEAVGTRETVQITPRSGWLAGESYLLRLAGELTDGADNSWGKELEIRFEVEQSEVLDTYELGDARDMVRLGSLLFVAGASQGLVILDASDPTNIKNLIPGDVTFPFILSASVRGVAVDPHGRVLIVGGGDRTVGQMLILDPLALDPEAIAANPDDLDVRYAAFRGNTIVSNNSGGIAPNLPVGTPRRTAVLSNDDREEWRLGDEPPPGGITVTPTEPPAGGGDYQITITGSGAEPGLPVTVRDLEGGRWNRVDADDGGGFSLALTVGAGNTLEVLRNRNTIAYVAVNNAGVAAVDVNAFYNEPPDNPIKSDVVGFFTGEGAGIDFCDEPIPNLGPVLNVGVLADDDNPVALAIPTLVFWKGLEMIQSSPSSPGAMQHLTNRCITEAGSQQVVGLDVLPDFAFDLNGDGRFDESERRDYLVIGHAAGGILIYDVTNRGAPSKVATIKLPGSVNHVTVDRTHRRVFGAGYGGGLWVVDLNAPLSNSLEDVNADGKDDRILESIQLEGTTKSPLVIDPELGLVYVGGSDRGLTAVSVDEPLLTAIAKKPGGGRRLIDRVAPYGVPTAPDGEPDASGEEPPDQVGAFRVLASLPGFSGDEIELDLEALSPGGLPIDGAGDPDTIDGLPRVSFTGADALTLRRLSEVPTDTGYQLYVSEEIAVVADLRAARDYERSADENDEDLCPRCDPEADDVSEDALQLLSGDKIKVSFPADVRSQLAGIYSASRLDAAELELDSVRWEMSPAVRQEPTQYPSFGSGDVAPGTLLHSGEFSHRATDLAVRGRGFDFSFSRVHRTQTLGDGPCGPGCFLTYRQRLRELPNGDVEYYDGTGRRELYEYDDQQDKLVPPPGRFAELRRTANGFLMIDAGRNLGRFDRFGRLASLADSLKESEDTGNEMTFGYDLASRLTRITDTLDRDYTLEYSDEGRLEKLTDFGDRDVVYEYDDDGRLTEVGSPEVSSGGVSGRLTTALDYAPATGGLAETLNQRDNLTALIDAKDQEWLSLSYQDADGDGLDNEVSAQTWGGFALGISYDFDGRTTTVTDRRGNPWAYTHNADGQVESLVEPTSAAIGFEYNDDGMMTKMTEALGRVTAFEYDEGDNPRSRGNVRRITVTADSRGSNGSSPSLVTQIDYDPITNQPAAITGPRTDQISISRRTDGLPSSVARPEGSTTVIEEYNEFGQPVVVVNPNGHRVRYDYFETGPSKGYLRQVVVDPDGLALTTRYETDARGNVTSITDPRGVIHRTAYNELNWTVSSTAAAPGSAVSALNYTTEYLYDANGNLAEERQPFGAGGGAVTAARFQYGILNELRQTTREAGPGGSLVTEDRTYDPNFNVETVTDPENRVTARTYDSRNLLQTLTRGANSGDAISESYAHNADRERIGFTNGIGKTRTWEYDGYGRVLRTRDPLGNRAEIAYDDGDNPVSIANFDSSGSLLAQTLSTHDLLNRPRVTRRLLFDGGDPASAEEMVTTTIYDAASNVRTVIDPKQRSWSFDYDSAERMVGVSDPGGNRMDLILDPAGNTTRALATETVSGGSVTVPVDYQYDALNRQVSMTDALDNTTQVVYDARSNVIRALDPEGSFTQNAYDGLNRLTSTTRPEGISLEFGYDRSSRLVSYRDARGNETNWTYDALNRQRTASYPGGGGETLTYDGAHRVLTITDGNNTTITHGYDDADRLTSRSIELGDGVEGPTAESFVYDGLNRVTQATSSGVSSSYSYDSLSRLTSETSNGKTIVYEHDRADNPTLITYPSGLQVSRELDGLDRPIDVGGAVSYSYRGSDLIAARNYANGVGGAISFDDVRRPTNLAYQGVGGTMAMQETIAWSKRGLKVASLRGDLGGRGLLVEYDDAGRLLETAKVPQATAGNNELPTLGELTDGFAFDYDPAENLLSRSRLKEEVETPHPLPLLVSGGNRPAESGGVDLVWDANGNLIQKGDLEFHYDYRNRLTRVTSPGGELAAYTYDAFNRRVLKDVGGQQIETVWGGWQPLEEYSDGELADRRTYGTGLDEIVRLESDVDGDGTLEGVYTPLYDSTGNLVAATAPDGRVVERYEYSPFGDLAVFTDLVDPGVEQVRTAGGAIWVELTEPVLPGPLADAVDGGQLALLDGGTVTVEQPVPGGRQGRRRVVITPDGPPAPGTPVTLVLGAAALVDEFGNSPAADFTLAFEWPADDTVLFDPVAPRLAAIAIDQQRIEIQLSEEADLTAAAAAITVDGQPTAWTLDPTRYKLTSAATFGAGAHELAIGTVPLDLAGLGLAEAFVTPFTVSSGGGGCAPPAECSAQTTEKGFVFEAPRPNELPASAIANRFGFHGLPRDPETGLVYARNRYYDPELGRFITDDPHLYSAGPNTGQFGMNSPLNMTDPMGTRPWGYATSRLKGGRGFAGYAFFDPIDPSVLNSPVRGPNGRRDRDNVQLPGAFGALIRLASQGGGGAPRNRLVLQVHGYNVNVGSFRSAMHEFSNAFDLAERPQNIYGFTWKGDPLGEGFSKPFFGISEGNADVSGYALGRLMAAIRGEAGGGTHLFAVTHSLGARTALRALQFTVSMRRSPYNVNYQHDLDGLFMFNAAVTRRSVSAGGFLQSAFGAVRAVRNFHSGADKVLGIAFRVRKFGGALGSSGAGPLTRDFQNLDMLDPTVAGTPARTHGGHMRPSKWGKGIDHRQLFLTLANELNCAAGLATAGCAGQP